MYIQNNSQVITVTTEPDYISDGHFYKGKLPHIKRDIILSLKIGTKLYTEPPFKEWAENPDTIPLSLIIATRDAICKEFGNNGTDGYYKRILAKVFATIVKEE